jgi:hypothetical protein
MHAQLWRPYTRSRSSDGPMKHSLAEALRGMRSLKPNALNLLHAQN